MWPRAIAGIQAAYLVVTGAWPLLHRGSFERVTGRKQDFWLVETVGGLALATGLTLAVATARGTKRAETTTLALASGVVFTLADIRASRTESKTYLADAVLQLAFAPAWLVGWSRADVKATAAER
jgi:hypothetical protein